eukprot:scaffold34005_cov63-Phaeocystis_antarctica.AAC.3
MATGHMQRACRPLAQVLRLVVCRLVRVLGLALGEIRHCVAGCALACRTVDKRLAVTAKFERGGSTEEKLIRAHRGGRDASVASRPGQRCRGDRTATTAPRAHLYLRPTGGVTGRLLRQRGGRCASGGLQLGGGAPGREAEEREDGATLACGPVAAAVGRARQQQQPKLRPAA